MSVSKETSVWCCTDPIIALNNFVKSNQVVEKVSRDLGSTLYLSLNSKFEVCKIIFESLPSINDIINFKQELFWVYCNCLLQNDHEC